jgi:hypothetical protein
MLYGSNGVRLTMTVPHIPMHPAVPVKVCSWRIVFGQEPACDSKVPVWGRQPARKIKHISGRIPPISISRMGGSTESQTKDSAGHCPRVSTYMEKGWNCKWAHMISASDAAGKVLECYSKDLRLWNC